LHAQLLDANGTPIPNVNIMFRPAGGFFEGSVDSTGMVRSGAVGTMPIAAIALVPGAKPVVQRFDIAMIAGPAARVDVAPAAPRMLPG